TALAAADRASSWRSCGEGSCRGAAGIGPRYPRRPDMILGRTISRMMPYQQPRGRSALKRLRVYLSVPDEFKEKPLETVEVAKRPPQGPFMSLGEIARLLGSKFE